MHPRNEPLSTPEAPRYVPSRAYPRYSYVPGLCPHPFSHPDGHSYGQHPSPSLPLTLDSWQSHLDYLWGFDLFNAGFYWEAHETWEAVWKATKASGTNPATGSLVCLVQGLIKLAAAGVKRREQNPIGTQRHLSRAIELLRLAVSDASPNPSQPPVILCGLNPTGLGQQVQQLLLGDIPWCAPASKPLESSTAPPIVFPFPLTIVGLVK